MMHEVYHTLEVGAIHFSMILLELFFQKRNFPACNFNSMYKSLEIENFRSIKHLNIEDLGRINVFLGRNNSSKTTILESLFLLIGTTNPELIIRIHNFRDLILNEANDLSFIFHNLDFNNTIKIKVLSEIQNDFREVTIMPSSAVSKTKKIEVDVENLSYESTRDENEVNELIINATIKKRRSPQKKAISKLTHHKGVFNLTPPNDFSDNLRGVYVTPKIPLAPNLVKELESLIINKQHRSLTSMLKAIDPLITDISFGTNRMIYVDVGMRRLIPFNLLGDGVRRYLSILLAIYNARDGVVLIDELENGLHFSTLAHLWDDMIRTSQEFNVQLYITTHNIETLHYLKSTLEKDRNKDFQQHVRAYTLRNINGVHKSYKYEFKGFENAIIEGIELR